MSSQSIPKIADHQEKDDMMGLTAVSVEEQSKITTAPSTTNPQNIPSDSSRRPSVEDKTRIKQVSNEMDYNLLEETTIEHDSNAAKSDVSSVRVDPTPFTLSIEAKSVNSPVVVDYSYNIDSNKDDSQLAPTQETSSASHFEKALNSNVKDPDLLVTSCVRKSNERTRTKFYGKENSDEEDMSDFFAPPPSMVRNKTRTIIMACTADTKIHHPSEDATKSDCIDLTDGHPEKHDQKSHHLSELEGNRQNQLNITKHLSTPVNPPPLPINANTVTYNNQIENSKREIIRNHDDHSFGNEESNLESSTEEFNETLQLSFDESPDNSRLRGSQLSAISSKKDDFFVTQINNQNHQQQQKYVPQSIGVPQSSFPYPAYYPHVEYPYQGSQIMVASSQQPSYHAYGYPDGSPPQVMPHGVGNMLGYPGFPHWGSPVGSYYLYHPVPPQPHYQQMQDQQSHYSMPPPETPASRKTPTMRTPAKRKDQRYHPNITVETSNHSFEDETGPPLSPPSSKKKRDGSLGVASWSSPSIQQSKNVMNTPHRGPSMASRSKRETPFRTPNAANFEDSLSFGATPGRDIFPAPSWSPGDMGAFFEEEGILPGNTNEAASLESWGVRSALGDIGNRPRHNNKRSDCYLSSNQASNSHSSITIRGSPILTKSVRSADSRRITTLLTPSNLKSDNQCGNESLPSEQGSLPRSSSSVSSGAFRIRIGSIEMETTDGKKSVDRINSILRGSPLSANAPTSHGSFTQPMEVTAATQTPTQLKSFDTAFSTKASDLMTPAAKRYGVGKENIESTPSSNPCNCKKSKCLKLYCECFAAERFCFDCKCYDCQNTPYYEDIRNKAISDTKAKNPIAFQPRIVKSETEHATGCKCKKSACLKKYCECFEGGIVCGENCKCVACQNYVGSQALIDRRRKIKDSKGAEVAMKSAEVAWRRSMSDPKARHYVQSSLFHEPIRPSMIRSPMHSYIPGHCINLPQTSLVAQSPVVFPHGMIHQAPPYSVPRSHSSSISGRSDYFHTKETSPYSDSIMYSTPFSSTKKMGFYSTTQSSRQIPNEDSYFGPSVKKQSRTTALSIFSFLSNDDLFNASIVSKSWSNLAFDKEIWQLRTQAGRT